MHGVEALHAGLSPSKDLSLYKVRRASGHGKYSEVQTAEEAKSLSRTTPTPPRHARPWCSKNQTHLYAGWRSTATLICGGYATPDYLQVHIYYIDPRTLDAVLTTF